VPLRKLYDTDLSNDTEVAVRGLSDVYHTGRVLQAMLQVRVDQLCYSKLVNPDEHGI
jgi:hypothetical protein